MRKHRKSNSLQNFQHFLVHPSHSRLSNNLTAATRPTTESSEPRNRIPITNPQASCKASQVSARTTQRNPEFAPYSVLEKKKKNSQFTHKTFFTYLHYSHFCFAFQRDKKRQKHIHTCVVPCHTSQYPNHPNPLSPFPFFSSQSTLRVQTNQNKELRIIPDEKRKTRSAPVPQLCISRVSP